MNAYNMLSLCNSSMFCMANIDDTMHHAISAYSIILIYSNEMQPVYKTSKQEVSMNLDCSLQAIDLRHGRNRNLCITMALYRPSTCDCVAVVCFCMWPNVLASIFLLTVCIYVSCTITKINYLSLPVCLPACLPARLTARPPARPPRLTACPPACLPITTPACLSQHLPAYHNTCLPITTPACLSQHLPAYHNTSPPITTPVCLSQHLPAYHNTCLPITTPACLSQHLPAYHNNEINCTCISPCY